MSMNVVTLLYLIASICFIQALKGLSHPTTSIRGNLFGMVGMAIAILTTAALIVQLSSGNLIGMGWVLLGLVAGGGYGAYRAKTVEMTAMPELVAFFHSMIGMAAVFIAIAAVVNAARPMPAMPNRLPRIEVVGWLRPFRAWMKQTLAMRYSSVTTFMLMLRSPCRRPLRPSCPSS